MRSFFLHLKNNTFLERSRRFISYVALWLKSGSSEDLSSSTAAFLRSFAASNIRTFCSPFVLQLDEGGCGQHLQQIQVHRPHLREMRHQHAHARREVLEMQTLLGCALLWSNLPTFAFVVPQSQLLPQMIEGQAGVQWFPQSGRRWNRLQQQFDHGSCQGAAVASEAN